MSLRNNGRHENLHGYSYSELRRYLATTIDSVTNDHDLVRIHPWPGQTGDRPDVTGRLRLARRNSLSPTQPRQRGGTAPVDREPRGRLQNRCIDLSELPPHYPLKHPSQNPHRIPPRA